MDKKTRNRVLIALGILYTTIVLCVLVLNDHSSPWTLIIMCILFVPYVLVYAYIHKKDKGSPIILPCAKAWWPLLEFAKNSIK